MTKSEMRFIRREYIQWYLQFSKNLDHVKESVREHENQEFGYELAAYKMFP